MELGLIQKKREKSLLNNFNLETLPYKDTTIKDILLNIGKQNIQILKEDTLGNFFEAFIGKEEKKDLGQFYTPKEIVEYIINFLNIQPDSKILDPTCGCGIFLVTVFNFLKHLNQKCLNNIYGVDLNETAVKITQINLWLKNGKTIESLKIIEKNIQVGNSIVEDKNIDSCAFVWKDQFPEIMKEGGFDFIIGNPPYLTLRIGKDYNPKESLFSKITNGNTNAASLIIAKSFQLLKNNGVISFVLPKTLVRVNSYSKLREFILENSKILHIYDLGNCFKGVRGEQIIIFMQKTNNKEEINQNKVLISIYEDKTKSLLKQKKFLVPQELFLKYNNFLMFEKQEYYDLIKKINEQGKRLDNLADIFRGITISPKSTLISKSKVKNSKPIIKGKDISKFKYKINYFLKNIDKISEINLKISQFYNNKIILQNIFSSEAGIIAAIDKSGNLTFDTVTNIIIRDKSLDEKYLLGLLNSKLINFFLIYAIYNKSKLTMHTDKVYLGKLPVKKVSKEKQKEIINIVNKLMRIKEKRILLQNLDTIIYKIYNINKKERNLIEESLVNIMSKKSIW